MEFEYDPAKSILNHQKHGIDFEQAQLLWNDENRVQIPATSDTEPRFGLMARHENKIWIAFFTMRQQATRLISVRRARPKEEQAYDSGRIR